VKRLGVLGWPVAHSRSPAMHNAALAELGLKDWHYQRLPVPPEVFEETVRGLPGAGFVGANVTIPHKEAALALADRATDAARAIGAANTLTFEADGAIAASNTDAPGFLAALRDAGADPAGQTALVLGAGGSARGVAYALREAGAARVAVWNRTPDRARALAADLGVEAVDRPIAAELLVNCTSVGLADGEFKDLPLDADALGTYATVADLVYRAGGTGLVAQAQRRGCTVVDGLEVLVRQGAMSLEAWTGREAPIDVMRAAAARGANPDAHDPGTSDSPDRRAADPRRTDR
jgi:shikimate dehydrogenase